MFFLDQTLPTPAENLALDEALLLEAEDGGPPVLRVWEWHACAVVLGAGTKLADDVDEQACRDDNVPVLRRSSGGGTVLLGPGCLLYSLVLPFTHHRALMQVQSSYRHILRELAAALTDLAPEIVQAGTSDLACGARKFSGNAQQRKRTHLLHHGTLLYDFDLAKVGRYLKQPARQPDYRGNRDHAAFLMNLPIEVQELTGRLSAHLHALVPLKDWPRARTAELVQEKFGQEDWIRRR